MPSPKSSKPTITRSLSAKQLFMQGKQMLTFSPKGKQKGMALLEDFTNRPPMDVDDSDSNSKGGGSTGTKSRSSLQRAFSAWDMGSAGGLSKDNSAEWQESSVSGMPGMTVQGNDIFEQKLLQDLDVSDGVMNSTSSERSRADSPKADNDNDNNNNNDDDDDGGGDIEEEVERRRQERHRLAQKQPQHDESDDENEEEYDDDFDENSIFDLSIMSLNTVPFVIQEEGSDLENDDDQTFSRRLRNKGNMVLSTGQAYDALVMEYANLMDEVEIAEEGLDRRKNEKNQLSSLVLSREEEYVERRKYVHELQAHVEELEEEIMQEQEKTQVSSKANKWTSKQKEAWERLDKVVGVLDELREENNSLVEQLQKRPDVTDKEIKVQMHLSRRLKRIQVLRTELNKLQDELNRLRGKKRIGSAHPLIGKEISVGDNSCEQSTEDSTCTRSVGSSSSFSQFL